VTADSQAAQVLSIDVSDYDHMTVSKIKKQVDLTGPTDTATGKTLTYADGYLYVGLTKSPDAATNAAEFRVLDASDLDNPAPVGTGFRVRAEVNAILINGDDAYIATASTSPLIKLDLSHPSAPIEVDHYYLSNGLTGQSLALSADGQTLFLGLIGGNANPKFMAFDIDDLSSPKWKVNLNKQDGIYTLVPRGTLLFSTTALPSGGFDIWNISNLSSAPPRYDTDPLNLEETSTAGADCAGNYIYVGEASNHALQIIGPS
jgi:uncharacterized secreted protein with C-terminal beta-propeller domain